MWLSGRYRRRCLALNRRTLSPTLRNRAGRSACEEHARPRGKGALLRTGRSELYSVMSALPAVFYLALQELRFLGVHAKSCPRSPCCNRDEASSMCESRGNVDLRGDEDASTIHSPFRMDSGGPGRVLLPYAYTYVYTRTLALFTPEGMSI